MILSLPQLELARAQEPGDSGDECGEGSTPGLVIKAQNPWRADQPRFTLTAHTSKDGIPKANVVYEFDGNRLRDFEVHRVFLRGDHDHETTTTSEHDGDHTEGLGVGIRGLGTLENGERVRAQIDLWEVRGGRDHEVRVRWRDFDPDEVHEPGGGGGDCPANPGWTSTGWIQIQQVALRQH
ncbi:MAG: hypothetical protein R3A46_14635 [Thermomicrobiales bacterium]